MDSKNEMFDLAREKRELDDFLATIAEEEIVEGFPVAESTALKDVPPVTADSEFESRTSARGGSDYSTLETSPAKETGDIGIDEFIPELTLEETPTKIKDTTGVPVDKGPSLFGLDDEQRPVTPRAVSAPVVKPLESFKMMTRYDGTIKYEGAPVTELSPEGEKKGHTPAQEGKRGERESLSDDVSSEKKSDGEVYDFAPTRKGGGLKWAVLIVLVLLLALAGGYYWFSSGPSVGAIGDLFKTGLSVPGSSVKEIKLINVRQRLVYNAKLGRSIRIIEGVAENSASFPVSDIKIAANLYNADGSLLMTKETLGGNLLSDAKLESLDENVLLAELGKANASKEIIPPGGQTPFMVILTTQMEGVHRMSVKITDFDRH